MAYEHHSETIYTARALEAIADPRIPAKVKPLWALLVRLSKNGREPVFASAAWYAGEIDRAVSVFYEHRAILVELGLIRVEERRSSYDRSAPSLIFVQSLREVSTGSWVAAAVRWWKRWRAGAAERRAKREARRAERAARNTGSPVNRRQKGSIKNGSSKLSEICALQKVAQRLAARAAFLERTGWSQAQLDLIPDAAESAERSRC